MLLSLFTLRKQMLIKFYYYPDRVIVLNESIWLKMPNWNNWMKLLANRPIEPTWIWVAALAHEQS